MKTLAFALTALTLATGAATASSTSNDAHQRPAALAPAEATRTVQVPAGTVMTARELAEARMSATDLVTITQVSTTEETAHIDNSSRGFF